MDIPLAVALVLYIALFCFRHFVIQKINKERLLQDFLRESSLTFIRKVDDLSVGKSSRILLKKYNFLMAMLWTVTVLVLIYLIVNNIRGV